MLETENKLQFILVWTSIVLAGCLLFTGMLFGFNWSLHKFERFASKQKFTTYETTEISDIRIKEIEGKKRLMLAEWDRKIQIADANAKAEAAKALAQVEIERAKGVAEANRIIGSSLRDNESYLRYLWIDKLHQGNQVIYIPTEAGLPVLEAGKR
jgi:hypothetical protein